MPNRILKDTIRTSKDVNALSDFDFRVWTYLITYVDDYGRGSADPELLKGLVFPRRKGMTEAQISKAIANLATAGMVTLYNVDGEPYLLFPSWDKHQQIRAKKSRFPAPDGNGSHVQSSDINGYQAIANAPVIQSESESEYESENESESESESDTEKTRVNAREERFARFWAAYPRKTGKGEARKVFEKINPSESLTERMIEAVQAQAQSSQWRREGGQFIPHPATWLRQGRWEDEPDNTGDGAPRNLFAEYAIALEAEGGVL